MIPCGSLIAGIEDSLDGFKINLFIEEFPHGVPLVDYFIKIHFVTCLSSKSICLKQ